LSRRRRKIRWSIIKYKWRQIRRQNDEKIKKEDRNWEEDEEKYNEVKENTDRDGKEDE
jgi:hypothetical protein